MATRRKLKSKAENEKEKLGEKLVMNLLREHAIKTVLKPPNSSVSPQKRRKDNEPRKRDLYELDPADMIFAYNASSSDEDDDDHAVVKSIIGSGDVHSVDFISDNFKELPPELQHEVLLDLKDTRKQNSWGKMHLMPQESGTFSSYQMARLLKRRALEERLEEVGEEIRCKQQDDAEALYYGGSTSYGLISDENKRYIYEDLKAKKSESTKRLNSSPKRLKLTKMLETSSESVSPKKASINNIFKKAFGKTSALETVAKLKSGTLHVSDSEEEDSLDSERITPDPVDENFLKDPSGLSQEEILRMIKTQNSDKTHKVSDNKVSQLSVEFLEEGAEESSNSSRRQENQISHHNAIEIVIKPDLESPEDDLFADVFEAKPSVSQNNDTRRSSQGSFDETFQINESLKRLENSAKELLNNFNNSIPTENLNETVKSSESQSLTDARVSHLYMDTKNAQGLVPKDLNISTKHIPPKEKHLKPDLYPKQPVKISRPEELIQVDTKPKESHSSDLKCLESQKFSNPDIDQSIESFETESEGLETRNVSITSSSKDVSELVKPESEATANIPSSVDDMEAFSKVEDEIESQVSKQTVLFENVEDSIATSGSVEDPSVSSSHKALTVEDADIERDKNKHVLTREDVESTSDEGKKIPDERAENMRKENNEFSAAVSERGLYSSLLSLQEERSGLSSDKGRHERIATSITDQMYVESQELLRLFGLPYIISPMEAEAQCAFLDHAGLTHGTITDDSDVWLFGGQRVYKNFFNNNKFVEFFRSQELLRVFQLTRSKMISLALLAGSDYTPGIYNVGPVTAMEIMSEFPGEGLEQLQKFKTWWKSSREETVAPVAETRIKNRCRSLFVSEEFPDPKVIDAYLYPEVDTSNEKFQWGKPDTEKIAEFIHSKLGWSQNKLDELLLPVIKKLKDKTTQMRIDSYFAAEIPAEAKSPSKRVQRALYIKQKRAEADAPLPQSKPVSSKRKSTASKKKTSRPKPQSSKKATSVSTKDVMTSEALPRTSDGLVDIRAKSKLAARRRAVDIFQSSRQTKKKQTQQLNLSESSSETD